MTSQPRRIASRISALPSGNDRMPSWGNAMRRRSTTSRISSRSSSRARSATSFGSHTSTCERMRPVPWATSQRIAWRARSFTSSWVRCGLRSAHVRMPSMSVPDSLWRGSPTVRTASRWTCGSTRGGERRRPSAFSSRAALPLSVPAGRMASMRSPLTATSTSSGADPLATARSACVGWRRAPRTTRSTPGCSPSEAPQCDAVPTPPRPLQCSVGGVPSWGRWRTASARGVPARGAAGGGRRAPGCGVAAYRATCDSGAR